MKTVIARLTLFLTLSLVTLLWLAPRPAVAKTVENPFAESAPSAFAESFLHSTLDPYRQETDNAFKTNLKTLQKTVNELSERLEKVADPKTTEEIQKELLDKIAENRRGLQDITASFTELADRAGSLNEETERSLQELVDRFKNQVGPRLNESKDSFTGIAGAISALIEDTTHLNEGDLRAAVLKIGERITALNEAIGTGNQAVKAFTD
jgi:DNA repair exonuclease SbcCD ATPase subunit